MALINLSAGDGSWPALRAAWRAQCVAAGEDPDLYAQGTFLVLDPLAAAQERRSGVYAVRRDDGQIDVICQVNTTPLPGHPEPVLRVRMVTVSPEIDFGVHEKSRYIDALADLFLGIVELSHDPEMGAQEFKLHLRSPEDFNFFRVASRSLAAVPKFKTVSVHGAWLHVTRA